MDGRISNTLELRDLGEYTCTTYFDDFVPVVSRIKGMPTYYIAHVSAGSSVKLLRILRLMRCMRLLRLAKLRWIIARIKDLIDSESRLLVSTE